MSGPQQPVAARRAQVAHACSACRASKVKCSGERPACTRCCVRKVSCTYDVLEPGMTKRESMKRQLAGDRRQLEDALAILDVMRYGSDLVATETLARLRMGMDLEQVLSEHGSQRSGWSGSCGESEEGEGVEGKGGRR